MEDLNKLRILKLSFAFAIDTMEFCEKLVELNKKPISERILHSTLGAICALQKALYADKRKDKHDLFIESTKKMKNSIYWLDQCQKSGYIYNEKLFRNANELLAFNDEELKNVN